MQPCPTGVNLSLRKERDSKKIVRRCRPSQTQYRLKSDVAGGVCRSRSIRVNVVEGKEVMWSRRIVKRARCGKERGYRVGSSVEGRKRRKRNRLMPRRRTDVTERREHRAQRAQRELEDDEEEPESNKPSAHSSDCGSVNVHARGRKARALSS